MTWNRGVWVVGTLLAAALIPACSHSTPRPAPTTTLPTPPPTTQDTSSAPAIPSYTPPPTRGLTRPPGVPKVTDTPCDPAVTDEHFYEVAWYGSFASHAEQGEPVPDSEWPGADRILGRYLAGVPQARTALRGDGVPASYAAYRDLTDLDTAMRRGITAVRARDGSAVLDVYFALKTAHDHLLESCVALER